MSETSVPTITFARRDRHKGDRNMEYTPSKLKCDGVVGCAGPITHLDNKGFIYCADHGVWRQETRGMCRKLRPYELNRLARGERIAKY